MYLMHAGVSAHISMTAFGCNIPTPLDGSSKYKTLRFAPRSALDFFL